MNLELAGDRILVVGASEGIGYATAAALAREGARVVIASRRQDAVEQAAARLADEVGQPVEALTVDVTNADSVLALQAQWQAQGWPMDALVVATGGSRRARFEALDDEAWLANYEYNVLGGVRLVRAFLPLLRQARSPRVLLCGAAASKMPYPNQVVSNVHKAGLLALTKTLAGELSADRIRVNSICPGRTLTKLWTDRARDMAAAQGVTTESIIAHFAQEIPAGRFAQAQEIGDVAAFLLSARASYIVGQSINVDGGIARGLL